MWNDDFWSVCVIVCSMGRRGRGDRDAEEGVNGRRAAAVTVVIMLGVFSAVVAVALFSLCLRWWRRWCSDFGVIYLCSPSYGVPITIVLFAWFHFHFLIYSLTAAYFHSKFDLNRLFLCLCSEHATEIFRCNLPNWKTEMSAWSGNYVKHHFWVIIVKYQMFCSIMTAMS